MRKDIAPVAKNEAVVDKRPVVFSVGELQVMELPPIEWLISPLVPQKGISMIAAPRGVGKSFLAMAIAVATASGFGFLGFSADKPRRVLYLDGEMNGRTLQDRFNALIAGFEAEGKFVERQNLLIYGCDFQNNNPMPDFANKDSQAAFERLLATLGDIDLIIIDNVFTLYGGEDENSASNWKPFNDWCVSQRTRGRSVLWIHHTGKKVQNGGRGSSAIETLMDSSLLLNRPQGYQAKQGALIVGSYQKTRSVAGEQVADFAARLVGTPESLSWQFCSEPTDEDKQRIIDLYTAGHVMLEIEEITGISKSTVQRIIAKAGVKKPTKQAAKNVALVAVVAPDSDNTSSNLFEDAGVVDLSDVPDDLPY